MNIPQINDGMLHYSRYYRKNTKRYTDSWMIDLSRERVVRSVKIFL